MMYPFLTLDDSTEIVHSQTLQDGNVKVYIEKPDEKGGFHHATCFLPEYRWIDIFGFSDTDIQKYQKIIESTAHTLCRRRRLGKCRKFLRLVPIGSFPGERK